MKMTVMKFTEFIRQNMKGERNPKRMNEYQ